MLFYFSIQAAGLSFLFFMLLFIPMEKVFPAKKEQPFFRKGWVLDLCFFLGQYIAWGALVVWILTRFGHSIQSITPLNFRESIAQLPWMLQALLVVFLSDLLIYWGHRLQHNVPFLWKFHRVHHSATHLDWLAAHREHPLDTLYTVGLINLPAFLLGFDLETISALIAFRGIWAIYIHSNVRIPTGPLRYLIGAPELHHWHHHRNVHAGNYANISPLMDLMFGTYHCPDHEPEELGITEPMPSTYAGQMIRPLLPEKAYEPLAFRIRTLYQKLRRDGMSHGKPGRLPSESSETSQAQ